MNAPSQIEIENKVSTDTKELETTAGGLHGIRVKPHSPRRNGPRDFWQVVVLNSKGKPTDDYVSITGNLGYWDGYFVAVKDGDFVIEYRQAYIEEVNDESVSVFSVERVVPQEGFPGEFIALGKYLSSWDRFVDLGIEALHQCSRGNFQSLYSIFKEEKAKPEADRRKPATVHSEGLRCSGCGNAMSPRSDGVRLCSMCRVCGIGDRGW